MNRNELVRKMKSAAEQVLQSKGYISVVDVLLAMGRLSKENYERWRFRRVPHLEKVLPGSLNEHAFFSRAWRALARELNLKPSRTVYTSWGKGRRQPLCFSKFGAPHVEEAFATHYVSPEITARLKARPTQMPSPGVQGAPSQDGR